MATTESAGKICIVCGKDVSGQPRVKDASGRYMCAGECQQKAAAAAKAKQGAPKAAPTKPGVVAQASAPVEGGGLLGKLIEDSPMLKSATCESCGNPMPGGAVLCTRCGFSPSTGKAIKTAVIVEKEKKEPKVKARGTGRYGNSGGSDWGPSFGVLFLIVAGVIGGLGALGFVNPMFIMLALAVGFMVHLVGFVWGMVDAIRQGETVYAIVGFFIGIVFLYYMLVVNEMKWSKSLYLGSLVGMVIAMVVLFAGLGGDFDSLSKAAP